MSAAQASFDETLSAALRRWEMPVLPSELHQLRAHFEAVVKTNRVMNLTRITDPVEAAVKHYADSLALLPWTRDRSITVRTILDVGTGAGFPAVPLAVIRSEWAVTAIDATRKKVEFLTRTVAAIGLTNVHVEHAHAAHWRPILRGSGQERPFDVVVVRALAPLGKCLDLCAAFVKPGGWLVAYKTASLDRAELAAAKKLLKKTRMRLEEPFPYELQMGDQTLHRRLHLFQRVR
ncbi:MAG: 16S rRNA (guanine(527)-N(7))-methyltransferase RsmG [Planctomycetota bacterium]